MNGSDRQLLEEIELEKNGHRATLQRVINASGWLYSVIVDQRGAEVGCAPTAQEKGLVKWWERSGWKM